MQVVRTIPELIKVLGGQAAVARLAGYEDSRGVSNWITRGIPPAYHLRLVLWAYQVDVAIHPDVFNCDQADRDLMLSVFFPKAPAKRRSASLRKASRAVA